MIRNMIKRIGFLLLISSLVINVNGQEDTSLDIKCKENRSVYYQYYKSKDYVSALNPWRYAFLNCPSSAENIFRHGPKIIKQRMSDDKENRSAYIDTLLMVFDQRIQYFGKEGYVLGLKGYELLQADKNRSEEALKYLEQSLEMEKNKSSVKAVYGYMRAMVNLEKSGVKTKADVLAAYDFISEIIQFNIVNHSKRTKNFIKYSDMVEKLFAPYANCSDLIDLFSKKISSQNDDIILLKRITTLLDKKECTSSELFFNASIRLYALEPSASSANQMSKMSISRGKTSDAITFAKDAVALEQDNDVKAKYYLTLADAYRSAGSYSSARNAVYNALELRDGWGEAYINLGNIYVAGAKSCGNDFDTQTVYWVAVDAFKRALLDSETKDRAAKSINTYSKYFPTKENCFFYGIVAGGEHTVECWIQQTTSARTSD